MRTPEAILLLTFVTSASLAGCTATTASTEESGELTGDASSAFTRTGGCPTGTFYYPEFNSCVTQPVRAATTSECPNGGIVSALGNVLCYQAPVEAPTPR